MSWWRHLWPFGRRERIEAEKEADEQFRAQLKQAVLRLDDLKEAAAQMKLATKSIRPPGPRPAFSSSP